jgi:cellulose synthase/poly-beta-1,6-N-acetylglucosamine synthase-like glycosyltransferase
MLTVLFWIACAGVLYAYLGFPAAAALLALCSRPRAAISGPNPAFPRVSVIIVAYNEEENIESKIRNLLETDYPHELLEILLVSDASTDRTNDIARPFERDGVRLILQERRRGKSAGLNRAMALAQGDIVVMTDANAVYPAHTIASLARSFDDPAIGLVTGYTSYVVNNGPVGQAIHAYSVLERLIKRVESRWGCCVGADGAVFAVRRSLYRVLYDDDINDLVTPLGVVEQGYRSVLAEDAFCIEKPGKTLDSEFRRQSRITNRTLCALWRNRRLLDPFRFGLFSFFLFSHKVIRFFVPALLMFSAAAVALLAGAGAVYFCLGLVILAALVLPARTEATTALAFPSRAVSRLLNPLAIFLAVNAAMLHGWWLFLCGRRDVVWQHDRSLTPTGQSARSEPGPF